MLKAKKIQSCIFYGSPGIGKTTAARILAEQAGLPFTYLNATMATTKDLKEAIGNNPDPSNPVLIYLDEIQYFNKRQQQTLLSFVEDGSVVLIAATTENPYHDVYKALLSRCVVLEFKPLSTEGIHSRLKDVLETEDLDKCLDPDTVKRIAEVACGDLRRALTIADTLVSMYDGTPITPDDAAQMLPDSTMGSFDRDGDQHYRYKAALQKSIRGSDPDAAVLWLMQMLEGGDIVSPSRRMLVMASEDVGMADPNALPIVLACVQAAERVGLPEARYPLSQAAIYLALAPKSNSIGRAFNAARDDIHAGRATIVPEHIASEHPRDYVYPHNFPNHWVNQQYMPDDLLGKHYWIPDKVKQEQIRAEYWARVKKDAS
jgi:putative ATPase